MRVLLISDSHGKKEFLDELLERNYNYVFFLGDGLRDLGVNVYDPKVKFVKGNCDLFAFNEPITETLFLEGHKILLTHGDYFKVKLGLETLEMFGEEKGYNLVCYGHTHTKNECDVNQIKYVNPGSLKNGDYAEITLNGGKIEVVFKNINNE